MARSDHLYSVPLRTVIAWDIFIPKELFPDSFLPKTKQNKTKIPTQSEELTKPRLMTPKVENSVSFWHNFGVPKSPGVWFKTESPRPSLELQTSPPEEKAQESAFSYLSSGIPYVHRGLTTTSFKEVWFNKPQIKPVQKVTSHCSIYRNVHCFSIPHHSPTNLQALEIFPAPLLPKSLASGIFSFMRCSELTAHTSGSSDPVPKQYLRNKIMSFHPLRVHFWQQ